MIKSHLGRYGGLALGTTAILLVLASTAWACTKLEGTITWNDTSLGNGDGVPAPNEWITVTYSGGGNDDNSSYIYRILVSPTNWGDAYCSPFARANGLAGGGTSYEVGTADAGSSGGFTTSVQLDGAAATFVQGPAQLCVYSVAVYSSTATGDDTCAGNVFTGPGLAHDVECDQAGLTQVPRRGQVLKNFVTI